MIDQIDITIRSGSGGNGAISGRREKFEPHGGPDGGDGGDGGSVSFRADPNIQTLVPFRKRRVFRAGNGRPGGGKGMDGAKGEDVEISVPVGTEIENQKGDLGIVDLDIAGKTTVAVMGGKGGRGNRRFATSVNRFPLLAEEGDKGETTQIKLTLKLIADVGIIGVPNAGKSSLLAAVTAATPKVASYPFTTLEPALGVVDLGTDGFVMADIPGLIEGAHAGVGIGDEFLRHIERTRVLVHVIDGSSIDPVKDYETVREELAAYGNGLVEKTEIVVINKVDIPGVEEMAELLKEELPGAAVGEHVISAAGRIGIDVMVSAIANTLAAERTEEADLMRSTPLQTREASERRPLSAGGETPVLRPQPPDKPAAAIRKHPDGRYEVNLRAAERFAGMLDVNNWAAVLQFHDQLRKLGVADALEKAGVKPGDTVIVGKHELDWGE